MQPGYQLELLLKASGVSVAQVDSVSGTQLRMNCPLCGDQRARLYYSVDKNKGMCFNCNGTFGTPGRLAKAFDLTWLPNAISFEDIAQTFKVEEKKMELPDIEFPICAGANTSKRALRYLESRGVTSEQIDEYEIKYCYDKKDSLYFDRVILPIIDPKKNVLGFVARAIENEMYAKPKMYPKGSKPSAALLGYPKYKKMEEVALVEGYFDYLKVEHVHPVMCTFGVHVSPTQLKYLKASKIKIIKLLWDGDVFTNPQLSLYILKLQKMLKDNMFKVETIRLPEDKDPNDLSLPFLKKVLRLASW